VASADSRLKFANNILHIYEQYNLDGIDIDWEYPGQAGSDGNSIDVQHDTTNFLTFLQLLRQTLPSNAKITAATPSQPWVGPDGKPLKDMSGFAEVLDWILIMNYDVWGSSSTPGPNAPLSDKCGSSTQPGASADAAVKTWTTAGFPVEKITLGLPSYGYLSRSDVSKLHNRSKNKKVSASSAAFEVQDGAGNTDSGQVSFRSLVKQGALIQNAPGFGGTMFKGAHGFERLWDDCSSTPFLRSEEAHQVITYDDPESLSLKATFAAKAGLKGFNMFDVDGDTDYWHLIDAARSAFFHDSD
jgi:chitinase